MSHVSLARPLPANPYLNRAAYIVLIAVMGAIGVAFWISAVTAYVERVGGKTEPGVIEDYVVFYAAGRLITDGEGGSLYDQDEERRVQFEVLGLPAAGPSSEGLYYLNPPFVAAAVAPISLLPLNAAAAAFAIIGALLVAGGAALLLRYPGIEDRRTSLALTTGFLSFLPVVVLFIQGQMSMLLLFGWLGFAVWLLDGKERRAGLAIALMLLKPQIAIVPVALLVWKRRWRALVALTVAGGLLALVSVLVAGVDILVSYPRVLLQYAGQAEGGGLTTTETYGWNGFWSRLFAYGSPVHSLATLLSYVATAALLFKIGSPALRPGSSRNADLFVLAALIPGSLLLNPHVHLQDLVILGVSLALSLRATREQGRDLAPWLALAGATWLAVFAGWLLQKHADVNLVTPLILGLVLFNGWESRRSGPVEAAQPRQELRAA